MAQPPTVTRRLAEMILEESLDDFVTSRRMQSPPRAWRLISRDLWEATDSQIDVTYETLRSWYPELAEPQASAS